MTWLLTVNMIAAEKYIGASNICLKNADLNLFFFVSCFSKEKLLLLLYHLAFYE